MRLYMLWLLSLALAMGACSSFEHEGWSDDDSAGGSDDDDHGDDDTADDDTADDDTGDDDTGGTPDIYVDPPTIDFVDDVLGDVSAGGLRIFNVGDADLSITGISLLVNAEGLSNSTWTGIIAPGADERIENAVVADCHTVGTLNDTLQITCNDPDSAHVEVAVSVECIDVQKFSP